ncbi:MAG: NfeD family protein [Acidimicrobiia bacterium]|nr:NfeD family protein [Acidimicrobiia bacterium]
MLRRFSSTVLLLAALVVAMPVAAQEGDAPVDIIEIKGPLDGLGIGYVIDEIEASAEDGALAVIIQIDSPGALSDEIDDLIDLVRNPPLPVAVWVGPAPARAYGGALQLFLAAPVRLAALGSEIGYLSPRVAGTGGGLEIHAGITLEDIESLKDTFEVSSPLAGLIDATPPADSQAVAALDGATFVVAGETISLSTVREVEVDGQTITTTVPVRFRQPGVVTRTARTALAPEAAFFFLIAGLAIAAFEFYAIGPGVAAGVAAASLLMAGYGLVNLPLRWWGILLVLLGAWLFNVDYQRGRFRVLSVLGASLQLIGGFTFTDGSPQIVPNAWGVVFAVIGVWLFYQFAMPTVARARFSTPTIGREHMVGRSGVAAGALVPDGEVQVDGARWKATARREAGIGEGDAIVVTGIDGLFLEVDKYSNRE